MGDALIAFAARHVETFNAAVQSGDFAPLVERMSGVAFSCRMERGVVKSQLKRAFADVLPQQIVDRDKVGFPVPLETIDFGVPPSLPPMDRWLEFNLARVAA